MGARQWLSAIVIGLAVAAAAGAQPPTAPKDLYANSWALVIGINAYQRAPGLTYAVADARAVADALPALGFPRQNIRLLLDGEATKSRIERVLYQDFARMGPDDRLFVYFAGHGETAPIKGGEEGYLLPADADPSALALSGIPMDEVRRIGQRVKAKHVLFVMDACFSGFAVTRDIAPASTTDEYLAAALREPVVQVITAGRKGQKAIEDAGHGLFTRRFLDALRLLSAEGPVTASQVAAWLEPRVVRDSRGRMTPQYGKLDGEGQFVLTARSRPSPGATGEGGDTIRQAFGSLEITARVPGVEVWLGDRRVWMTKPGSTYAVASLPAGAYRVVARKDGYKEWSREIRILANRQTDVMIDIEPLAPASAIRGEDGAEMVLIPAGEFLMGSEDYDDERPRHRVFLDAYYIDRYEVTNGLYRRFLDATATAKPPFWNDPSFNAPQQPVVGVSWARADAYCGWAGKRLPTEAEWEKAARGPDGRRYPWGDQWDRARANSKDTNLGRTMPVGSYPTGASPYGVHDMAGNVYEWVADWSALDYYGRSPSRNPPGPASDDRQVAVTGGRKIVRGGSWDHQAIDLRTAMRGHLPTMSAYSDLGFRCVKSATP